MSPKHTEKSTEFTKNFSSYAHGDKKEQSMNYKNMSKFNFRTLLHLFAVLKSCFRKFYSCGSDKVKFDRIKHIKTLPKH